MNAGTEKRPTNHRRPIVIEMGYPDREQIPLRPLSVQFQTALDVQHDKGYTLHSWRMTSVVHADRGIIDLIVAVFVPADTGMD